MPHRISVQIQEYELHDLFDAVNIFDRIESGALLEVRREPIDRSRRCSLGGDSLYTRVYEAADPMVEVARIHYVRCVIGVYPSHIIIGDVLLYRRGHQRRPAEERVAFLP